MAKGSVIELTATNALDYLLSRGFIRTREGVRVEELGWGVSNVVLKVTQPGDSFVFKQSLPKLRVKDDWPFHRERIYLERDCMQLLSEILPEGAVPRVRFSDEDNFVFGMSCAPEGGLLWKQVLLDGDANPATAHRVGALLGLMHTRAAGHPQLRTRFGSHEGFIQGRVDPYHRTTAKAHPSIAPLIHAEVERMLARRVTLIHGDYSPKNLFIYPEHVLMLDFEVAHWGDTGFDVAFCMTHILLKAIKFPARRKAYVKAAQAYWNGYRETTCDAQAEYSSIRELGCLLLARIDGKSKEDYITEEHEKQETREIGGWILTANPRSFEMIWEKFV